ncbi:MAG TPA: hypothetical protein VNO30_21610 [Kofleriaceae bacterium]|nr:hypothetical protein [Kofleriaceae bacterium]
MKLTIASSDEPGVQVQAQYNPKELQVDQTVPWKKPDSANQTGASGGGGGSSQPMTLEFTGAEGRTMTVEFLFDGYEKNQSIAGQVGVLEKLASVRNPGEKDETKRRPHQCVISWGASGLPKFECVIESLSTKYTMFSSIGTPLRATCTVKLKEAQAVDKKPPAASGGSGGGSPSASGSK